MYVLTPSVYDVSGKYFIPLCMIFYLWTTVLNQAEVLSPFEWCTMYLQSCGAWCTLCGFGQWVGAWETLDLLGGVSRGTGIPCGTVHTGRWPGHGVGPRETGLDPCTVSVRTHLSWVTLGTRRGITQGVCPSWTRNLIGRARIEKIDI